MTKKIRIIGILLLFLIWAALTAFAWFAPPKETSLSERRPLDQFPKLTVDTLLSGSFTEKFEGFATDQFPLRDSFRSLKAITHRYALLQPDNNDIYLADGYLAKQEYPLNESEVSAAVKRLQQVYNTYLKETGSKLYVSVIPDKSYYLGEESGHLTMDYTALFNKMKDAFPQATYIDITDRLSAENYYYTDTHWRQETLLPVAETLCEALSMPAPKELTAETVTDAFYGVYYGQAALPLQPEDLTVLKGVTDSYTVGIHNGQGFAPVSYSGVYDLEKLGSKEPYDVFLSGPQSLLQITNPNATTDRELIIFRDSFGSSIAPLLVSQYKTVTLVDIRYLETAKLKFFMDFHGQDVLFLYSALVLNSGSTLK
ncbi:MAG: hypothetical protein IKU07_00315 [Oscillospiraceae bacterium]|nr:hypothetical protein [Oscillospiraceae bacterium]